MKINKKAALNLGISTVVVMVIAMVLIGAGVSFIRTIFSSAEDSLLPVLNLAEIDLNPDRNTPVMVRPREITLSGSSPQRLIVGVFNYRDRDLDVELKNEGCSGDFEINFVKIDANIPSGEGVGFTTLISRNSGDPGSYICSIEAEGTGGGNTFTLGTVQITVNYE